METETEHGRAAYRRVLTLRIVGLVLLAILLMIEEGHWSRKYVLFCAGCALIQLAYLDFPKAARDAGPARISVMELMHPGVYWWLSLLLGTLALVSFALELWAGFHFFHWKTVFFALVGTTIAVDLLAARVLWVLSGVVGFTLALVVGVIIIWGP
jgi:hypothetical protein